MPVSYVIGTVTGSARTNFTVPFSYMNQSHVHFYANGVEVAISSWPNATTIVVPSQAVGVNWAILRKTPSDPHAVAFTSGNITAGNLNLQATQELYVAEEAREQSVYEVRTTAAASEHVWLDHFGPDGTPDGDLAAFNAALTYMAANGRTQLLLGEGKTYYVRIPNIRRGYRPGYENIALTTKMQETNPTAHDTLGYPTYGAIKLQSNLTIVGNGAKIVPVMPVGGFVPKTDPTWDNGHFYVFYSDANINNKTNLVNIRFENLTFACDPTNWPSTERTLSGIYIVGATNVSIDRVHVNNSTSRKLCRGATLFNIDSLSIAGGRYEHLPQAYFLGYVRNLYIGDCYFRDFSEAIDIDQICWDTTIENCEFYDAWSDEQQAIDTSSMQNCTIRNLYAENIREYVYIYNKFNCMPDYPAFVALNFGNAYATHVGTKGVLVENIRGKNCGTSASRTFLQGLPREADTVDANSSTYTKPCEDVTWRSIEVDTMGMFEINEGINTVVRACHFKNVSSPTFDGEGAALYISGCNVGDPSRALSKLFAVVDNVTIEGCTMSGLYSALPQKLVLSNVTVRDYDKSLYVHASRGCAGILIANTRCAVNAETISIQDCYVEPVYDANQPANRFGFRITTPGSNPGATLSWGRNNRVKDGVLVVQPPLSIGGTLSLPSRPDVMVNVPLPSMDASANASAVYTAFIAPGKGAVIGARILLGAALTADATNHVEMHLRRRRAGTYSGVVSTVKLGDVARSEGASIDLLAPPSGTINLATASIEAGDKLDFQINRVGTGRVLTGAVLQLTIALV